MTIYAVTTGNWNDPSFWAAISESSGGHTLDFSGLPSNVSIDVDKSTGRIVLTDSTTTFTVGEAGYAGAANAMLGGGTLLDYFDTLTFGDGSQNITGDAEAEIITTGGGNDRIEYNGGADTVHAGDGDDLIDDAPGVNSTETGSLVFAGGGNDTVFGTAGDDTLHGGSGDDQLGGEAGNDRIFGGDGADVISGGTGDDRIASDNATPVGPNLIVNGSFEDTTGMTSTSFGSQTTGGSIPGWTDASSGAIDFHSDGRGGLAATDGTNWLDMEGNAGQHLAISQTIAGFQPDGVYQLSFDVGDLSNADDATAQDNTVDVYWNGQLIDNIDPPDGAWQTYTYHLLGAAGDGTGTLEFHGGGASDSQGASIDSVELYVTTEGIGGNDIITAGDGDDEVLAGAGDDAIDGGAGTDLILGGTGADTVTGGTGNDRIDLGFGDGATDAVILSNGDGNDTVAGFEGPIDNGDGTFSGQDQLDLSGMTDAAGNALNIRDIIVADDGFGNALLIFPKGDSIVLVGIAPADVSEENALAAMGVTASDDIVEGTAGADRIDTGYTGDPEGDAIDAADNAAGTDADRVESGAGNDTVASGAGNDTVLGGSGDDRIDGGIGNDMLYGQDGSDSLVGGDGDDLIDSRGGNGYGLPDSGYSDPANPGLTYTADPDPLNDRDTVDGGLGNDHILTGDDDDVITGGTGNDTIDAGFDHDSITGDAGADVIEGNAGRDTIDGGTGNDLIYGDISASNPLYPYYPLYNLPNDGTDQNPDDHADSIVGGDGDDTIFGQDDDDTISGGQGSDVIDGGLDDDSIHGGEGDDRIILFDSFGNDTIDGGALSETGGDTLDAGAITQDVLLDLAQNGGANPESGLIANGTDFATFTEIEHITLGSGNDLVFGSTGADIVSTGAGHDTINGGDGADRFDAGAGNDSITVDQGDTVTGGDGDDTFRLVDLDTSGTGNAAIYITGGEGDETGGDTLILTPGVTHGDITFSNTDDAAGGLSGSLIMADGTPVTFSEIENIICFTPGTMILTSHGDRAIETLQVGDLVVTRDQGLRPIRWIGQRTVKGDGLFAPIRVGANALDPMRKGLLVSPQHRILYTGYRAELLFGNSEVLVPAKHLVDGRDVLRQPCEEITYIHMMFDHHEVIYAEGYATESFHAGDIALGAIEEAAREELFALFPELRTAPGHHLETARTCLKKHEAALLIEEADGPHY